MGNCLFTEKRPKLSHFGRILFHFLKQGQQHLRREGLLCPPLAEFAAHGGNQLMAGLKTDPVALPAVRLERNVVGDGDVKIILYIILIYYIFNYNI